jgi:hypothetical protein
MELLIGPWAPVTRRSQEPPTPLDFEKRIAVEKEEGNLANIIPEIKIILKESLFFYLEYKRKTTQWLWSASDLC